MRARIHDPEGPWPGVGSRATRACEIVVRPGSIEVRGAGTRSQRIRSKDLTSASAARLANGVLLSLATRKRRRRPIGLELASDEDLRQVAEALGIERQGFGALRWVTGPLHQDLGRAARISGLLGALLLAASVSVLPTELVGVTVEYALMMLFVSALLAVAWNSRRAARADVVLDAHGVHVRTRNLDPRSIPYESIVSAEVVDGEGIRLVLDDGRPPLTIDAPPRALLDSHGLTPEERAHVVAQIRSAAQRARGMGLPFARLSEPLTSIARNGDAPRAWLARVDAIGAQVGAGAGYRGAPVEPEALWRAVEDPEASADVRAAAARILVRVDVDAAPRIEDALAKVREERVAQMIRVALDEDVARACEELEPLVEEGKGAAQGQVP